MPESAAMVLKNLKLLQPRQIDEASDSIDHHVSGLSSQLLF